MTVDEKVRFGDLEIDIVIGRIHKEAILTISDMAPRLTWIRLLSGKDAGPLTKAAIDALKVFLETKYINNGRESKRI